MKTEYIIAFCVIAYLIMSSKKKGEDKGVTNVYNTVNKAPLWTTTGKTVTKTSGDTTVNKAPLIQTDGGNKA